MLCYIMLSFSLFKFTSLLRLVTLMYFVETYCIEFIYKCRIYALVLSYYYYCIDYV